MQESESGGAPVERIYDDSGDVIITVSGRLSQRQIEQVQTAYLAWLRANHPELLIQEVAAA